MENKTRKYLAAACFGIIAILDIVDLVDYFYIGGLIFPIGSVLVVVSLLASMPVLSAAAFALRTVVSLFSCVGYFVVVQYGAISKLFLFVWGVAAIGDFLLMIASINPKSAKTLCTIATILLIIRLIALVAINVSDGQQRVCKLFTLRRRRPT